MNKRLIVLVAILALLIGWIFWGEKATATSPVILPQVCKTVPASKYNSYVRLRAKITGWKTDGFIKTKPTCSENLFKLRKSIRKQRRICKKKAIKTGASYYDWGDNDPPGSNAGRWGNLHDRSFAELGNGYAMGGLRPNSWWYIAEVRSNFSVHAEKRDYGRGGGDINGYTRGIDLWMPLRNALGMRDNGVVYVSKRDCWAKLKKKKKK